MGSKDILFHCPSVNKQQRKYKPVELQLWQGRGGVGRERGVGGGGVVGGGGGEVWFV